MANAKSILALSFQLKKISQNISLVFWLIFTVIFAFEIVTIYYSLKPVWNPVRLSTPSNQNKGVRINFENYKDVVKRIEKSASFLPENTTIKDPFSVDDPSQIKPREAPVKNGEEEGVLKLP